MEKLKSKLLEKAGRTFDEIAREYEFVDLSKKVEWKTEQT